jgi:hypothetical protein
MRPRPNDSPLAGFAALGPNAPVLQLLHIQSHGSVVFLLREPWVSASAWALQHRLVCRAPAGAVSSIGQLLLSEYVYVFRVGTSMLGLSSPP